MKWSPTWWQQLSLRYKLATLTTALVLCSFSIGLLLVGYNLLGVFVDELGHRAMAVARTVAQVESVRQHLGQPGGAVVIQPFVERMRLSTGVEYIVTFDMNRIRYSDPLPERIGHRFQGGDEGPSLSQQAYVTQAAGVNGVAVRAFAPVLASDGTEQVGVVVVGILVPGLLTLIQKSYGLPAVGLLGGLLVGALGAWVLAAHVKRQMSNLEPLEIAHILEERGAMVAALSEGLIAVDRHGTIAVINAEAQRITGVGPDAVGRNVQEVLPHAQLLETIQTGQARYNQQVLFGPKVVVVNQVLVRLQDRIVGAVVTFRERTEVHRLAEELTGVSRFIEGLRAQNHESLNKLHTIAGLIHMKQYSEALEFIYSTTEQQEEVIRFLARQVRDYRVSGLLLGKIIRGRELGVDLRINLRSRVDGILEPLDGSALVLILGNLLENAMEALAGQSGERRVECLVQSSARRLRIRVADNGPGVPPALQGWIFAQGCSTKGPQRGLGLNLVRQLVDLAGGRIELVSAPGETVFAITVGEEDPSESDQGSGRR